VQLALIHRCLHATSRVLTNSYLAYAPVPPRTWHDAHAIYVHARARGPAQHAAARRRARGDARAHVHAVAAAGTRQSVRVPAGTARHRAALPAGARSLGQAHRRRARCIAWPRPSRSFPWVTTFRPFSANKGGSIDGSKLFLLTFDLAFQIQEQLRALEAGGDAPHGVPNDPAARLQYIVLLKRLLRQWAIPPARSSTGLPSRARVVMCAGLSGVWQYSRGRARGVAHAPAGLPAMTTCQVINHTPAGYALRQIDPAPAALRIGDLIALRVEGRTGLQVAIVRWFRNTLKSTALEFGCELLSDSPEAAAAAAEDAPTRRSRPSSCCPTTRTPARKARNRSSSRPRARSRWSRR
jgi:hypothetical protein